MQNLSKEMFKKIDIDNKQSEEIARPSTNFFQDAWRRLKANKLSMLGLILIGLIVFMTIVGPYMVPYSYEDQKLDIQIDKNASDEERELIGQNKTISSVHWFGTDDLGRDIFARCWYGGKISLAIGVIAALADLVIGVIYGGISGYRGGKIDQIMMRIVDVLYALPYLLVVILLMVVINHQGIFTIIVALVATGWVGMARIVRGQILQVKEMEFVLAAKTLGADTKRLLLKHLVPNSSGPIIVNLTLTVPAAIFSEAFLSYIGLGVAPPETSWGSMISEGVPAMMTGYWWRLAFPAMLISVTMFAFNVFGDGLRDALDPKLRK